jgi:hypothetical protein
MLVMLSLTYCLLEQVTTCIRKAAFSLKLNHALPRVQVPNNLPLHIMSAFYCKQASSAVWVAGCCLISQTNPYFCLFRSRSEERFSFVTTVICCIRHASSARYYYTRPAASLPMITPTSQPTWLFIHYVNIKKNGQKRGCAWCSLRWAWRGTCRPMGRA